MQGCGAGAQGLQQRSVEGVAAPPLLLALAMLRSPGRRGGSATSLGGGGGGLPRLPLLAPLLPRGNEVRCFAVVVGPLGTLLGRPIANVAVAVVAALMLLQATPGADKQGVEWRSCYA